jgi:hypothetical protein
MNFSGFVNAGLQLGLQSIVIKPQRGFRNIKLADGSSLPDITAQAVIEEAHVDTLEITEHPVEQGASIADHAYKRPAEVTLHLGWSNSPSSSGSLVNQLIGAAAAISPLAKNLANVGSIVQGALGVQSNLNGDGIAQIKIIYASLLNLQMTRALFSIYTGKRFYTNMVCKSLSTESDYKSANSLPIKMVCQQVILVGTQTVQLDKKYQASPELTASTVDNGQQSTRSGK